MKTAIAKRAAALLMSLCFALMLLPVRAFAANGDEVRAAKRIISVVYDDSGSMEGARWSYANYAMQALIALLNEQDELYITFMSDPGRSEKKDTSNLPGCIQEFHDWNKKGSTPGEALDTARRQLDGIQENDATTQFWLVIMTDGGIDGLTLGNALQNKLDSFKSSPMSNGSPLNVVYMGMGAAMMAQEDKANHLHIFSADNDTEIVSALQDVAALVSGRLSPDQTAQTDSKTITVTSKLPLYSLSILSQQSGAQVVSAKTQEETLNIQRNLSLDAADLPSGEKIDSLYGNAAVVNKQSSGGDMQIIPAGAYTITFSSEIDIKNMTIQVEPAIGLKAEISRNGVIIDDMTKLENGDKVDIRIIPVVPGTDEVISDSDLPKQITWDIEYEVDGTTVDQGTGTSLTGVTLTHGSNIIRGTIHIPGYAPFISEVYFSIPEFSYHFGIRKQQPDKLAYNRSDMKQLSLDDTNTVRFELTNDGKPLSKEEQKSIGVSLQIDDVSIADYPDGSIIYTAGSVDVKCKLEQNDDGSYSLIPSCPTGIPIIALQAGDYTVKVSVSKDSSVTEEGQFTVVPSNEDAKDLPKILIGCALFLYLLYIFFIKHHFRGQTVHYERYSLLPSGAGQLQRASTDSITLSYFSGHFFLPTRSCFVKYHDLKLVAESDGMVMITGDSIAKAVYAYGTSVTEPEEDLAAIMEQMHVTLKSDGNREAAEMELTTAHIFFRNTETSKEVWCIWMTDD